jgi:integrase
MRKGLSDKGVAALKPRATRYTAADPLLGGHVVRIQPSGAKAYYAITRNPSGGQVWTKIGDAKTMTIADARTRAAEIIRRVSDGLPAIEARGETFGDVAGKWLTRHVDKKKLRSAHEIRRLLDRNILPLWKDREFVSIRRSDVTALLNEIEDQHSARQADYCLALIRSIMNFAALGNDDYTSPIVRGMRKQKPSEQSRSRVLTDVEIKSVWQASDACGTFGAFVKIALLTGQRRAAVAGMKWSDVKDGVWTIAKAPREKPTAGVLVLPDMAREIVEAQPRLASNDHVFAGRGSGPLNGFSKLKAKLDELTGVSNWVTHDLRRTARSLMSRAGVSSDHAERVLGHVRPGVEAVYDKHPFTDEKADALRHLAALIASIVNPPAVSNVVAISKIAAY